MTFYLVGIGLNQKQLTEEARQTIERCDEIYLETYTSKYPEGTPPFKATELTREKVENSKWLIEKARKKNIALLVYGNPLNATTHIQLLIDLKNSNIQFKVIPGISVFDYLGETGLDSYRFGRTATVVFPGENYSPESFYDIIEKNQIQGLHTLCLLDIQADKSKLMTVKEAIEILERIETKRKKSIIKNSVFVFLAGLGSENQTIKAGKLPSIKNSPSQPLPQSMIVCGKLNEKEKEALKILCDYNA